jgi:hypothetical protein
MENKEEKTQDEIIAQQSAMIAEFNNESCIINDVPYFLHRLNKNDDPLEAWFGHYHESWDWLMPVVEKIDNIYSTTSLTHKQEVRFERILNLKITDKIETVYKAVVEFIKWYNSNGK